MARRSSGGHGRGGSWLTACFFPSTSGKERGEVLGAEECVYVVSADYQRQESTEISLKAGKRVEVIEKSESGWWFVRTPEEQGWVPATFLVSLTGRRENQRAWNRESKSEWYLTVQPFSSTSQDELGFQSGAIVEVIQRNLEGWWFIRYGGKEGWAPAAYLRKIQDDIKVGNQSAETNITPPPNQVEIIGNLMEISNLLNKSHEHHSHTQTDTHSQTDTYTMYSNEAEQTEAHSKRTSSSSTTTTGNTKRASDDQHTHSADSSEISVSVSLLSGLVSNVSVSSPTLSTSKHKTVPPSPAIARVAPQRFHSVETNSPSNNQKPPPRRESSLVIEKNSGGWWYVQIGEKEGWAPCSYIDKRKKPSLNRQTSTLTRPKVPPPAPPIKKQNSLPCVESGLVPPTSPRVYEEPEYDVPAVGVDFDTDLDFFSCNTLTKSTPSSGPQTISFTLGQGDEDDDEGVYANGDFQSLPQLKDSQSEVYSSSAHHLSMWDPPEYDAPTIEPIFETNPALYSQSKKVDESKEKPSVRPKPTNQDYSSLRRPGNQEQLGQIQFKTFQTSINLDGDFQSSLSDPSAFVYCTTAAYEREDPCELSFPAGVQVEVLEKQESGWWFVRWGNEEGWAPTYYLQPVTRFEASSPATKTTEKIISESSRCPIPELEISMQVEAGKMIKPVSLEKNEQRVNQSLRGGHQSNQQDYRVGVKQLAVRPQNVLKENTNAHASPAGWKNDVLPRHSAPQSFNEQSSYTESSASMRRKVPVSMVKPKPHLIHNNLREEYVSIADYHGDSETMSFPAGTRLEVMERNPNGWWYCRVLDATKTRKGWVPSNFLERKS
ncbi:hypothetical protein DNTS_029388 [Danionella cerebrum]|uniref:SH3 domain-containing protein n=1 Tax=Danionella cerebrum TaxID=2873325 RepID=A0A553QV71_9TELE|nr:hypothetical protein DNTS_029388 [Danionella translucida]